MDLKDEICYNDPTLNKQVIGENIMALDWTGYEDKVPSHLRGGIERYVEHGIAPGGFLTKVFEGDLYGAVAHADEISQTALVDIVKFIYNRTPCRCMGYCGVTDEWADYVRNRT